jgi:hypothetical protein
VMSFLDVGTTAAIGGASDSFSFGGGGGGHYDDDNEGGYINENNITAKAQQVLLRDHIDRNLKLCITLPREMNFFGLYDDDMGRRYRPRRALTEEDNNLPTTEYVSEKIIWFDVYLLPTDLKNRLEKPEKVNEGEKINLKLRRQSDADRISVKIFECEVTEVYWGQMYRSNLSTGKHKLILNPNVGLIKVFVYDDYPRSLIIDSHARIQKYTNPLAL